MAVCESVSTFALEGEDGVISIGESVEADDGKSVVFRLVGRAEAGAAGRSEALVGSEARELDVMGLLGWRSATDEIDDGREPEPGGRGTARLAAARLGKGGGGADPDARVGVEGRVMSREVWPEERPIGSEAMPESTVGTMGGVEPTSTTKGTDSLTVSSVDIGAGAVMAVASVSCSLSSTSGSPFGLTDVDGTEVVSG